MVRSRGLWCSCTDTARSVRDEFVTSRLEVKENELYIRETSALRSRI
jgi:hypothetical protein